MTQHLRFGSVSAGCALVLVLLATCACEKKAPGLTDETLRQLIKESPAFQGPWDPGLRFVDRGTNEIVTAPAQRQVLKILEVKTSELAFGMAGTSATVWFNWRWQGGPLADTVFASKAKLHCSSGVWKVYSDLLQEDLWRAERSEGD